MDLKGFEAMKNKRIIHFVSFCSSAICYRCQQLSQVKNRLPTLPDITCSSTNPAQGYSSQQSQMAEPQHIAKILGTNYCKKKWTGITHRLHSWNDPPFPDIPIANAKESNQLQQLYILPLCYYDVFKFLFGVVHVQWLIAGMICSGKRQAVAQNIFGILTFRRMPRIFSALQIVHGNPDQSGRVSLLWF